MGAKPPFPTPMITYCVFVARGNNEIKSKHLQLFKCSTGVLNVAVLKFVHKSMQDQLTTGP